MQVTSKYSHEKGVGGDSGTGSRAKTESKWKARKKMKQKWERVRKHLERDREERGC